MKRWFRLKSYISLRVQHHPNRSSCSFGEQRRDFLCFPHAPIAILAALEEAFLLHLFRGKPVHAAHGIFPLPGGPDGAFNTQALLFRALHRVVKPIGNRSGRIGNMAGESRHVEVVFDDLIGLLETGFYIAPVVALR